jgi:hypothetical protein
MDRNDLVLLADPERKVSFHKLIDWGKCPERVVLFADQNGRPLDEKIKELQRITPVFSTKRRAESYRLIHGHFTQGFDIEFVKLGALVTGIQQRTLVLLNSLPHDKLEYDSRFVILENT